MYWQSKTYYSSAPESLRHLVIQKNYAVVNLMGRYAFSDQLSVLINLNNAFNKNYRTSPGDHVYGAERNLTATLKYQF